MTAIIQRHEEPAVAARDALKDAVLRTVAYADVFDFAPTISEVHRYLIGERATPADVAGLLAAAAPLAGRLTVRDGLVVLAGRESLFATRIRRRAATDALMPRAVRYARAVGTLPGVRMVAITGGLAATNDDPGSDIDLFLVTVSGRLWLTRAKAIGMGRFVARFGDELCPNYIVATRELRLRGQDLYGAQELAHMTPVVGVQMYRELRAANAWTASFLPNASGPPAHATPRPPVSARAHALADLCVRSPAWAPVERWERWRKIGRFRRQAIEVNGGELETSFGRDHCKGHFQPYGVWIRSRYEDACERLGVAPMWEVAA